MKRKQLGVVGVDSGQLVITDPCYIDSEWEKKEMQDIRIYTAKKDKKLIRLMFDTPFSNKDTDIIKSVIVKQGGELFKKYDSPLKKFGGQTINELLKKKEAKEIPHVSKDRNTMSYAGICETTLNNEYQINYKLGHPGAAVAFSSGYGDGCYPVYGTFNDEGRCVLVEIDCGITDVQANFFKQYESKPKKGSKKGSKQ